MTDPLETRIAQVLRRTRVNCTGPGEVGCPLVEGWHSWTEHHAHVAAEIAKALGAETRIERETTERWMGCRCGHPGSGCYCTSQTVYTGRTRTVTTIPPLVGDWQETEQ